MNKTPILTPENLELPDDELGELLIGLVIATKAAARGIPFEQVTEKAAAKIVEAAKRSEATTAINSTVEKAVHKAAAGDFATAGRLLKEHMKDRASHQAALASYTYRDKEFHRMRQRKNQSSERNRKGKADDVVDYVLDRLPEDERGMTSFREFVIRHTTLDMENAKIDVTPIENDRGTTTHFVFENRSISEDDPKARIEVKVGTIASSISRYPKRWAKRLKKQSLD